MNDEKLLAILRLQKTKGIGDITAKKLIASVGDEVAVFSESSKNLSKIKGLSSFHYKALHNVEIRKRAESELRYLKDHKLGCAYFLNDDYPVFLRHCVDAPILFFYKGNPTLITQRMLSMVGTRRMTAYGKQMCRDLVQALKPYAPTIVSGFAAGVDIESHKAALDCGLNTIAVLAHGFEHIYPKSHSRYMDAFMEKGGFITEFWHDEQPQRAYFLRRNRIVAGLSRALVIVESPEKGGALVTADIANSYDRDVFAVPGKISDYCSIGCNQLIRQNKAHLLTSAQDVIEMMNWDLVEATQTRVHINEAALSKDERKICQLLTQVSQSSMDDMALQTKIPVSSLATILLQLELKGFIAPLTGKKFSLV